MLPLAEQVRLQHGGNSRGAQPHPGGGHRAPAPAVGARGAGLGPAGAARLLLHADRARGRAGSRNSALGPVLTAVRSPRVRAARSRGCHGRAAAPDRSFQELTAYLVVRGAAAALRSSAAAAGAPVASGAEEDVRGRHR